MFRVKATPTIHCKERRVLNLKLNQQTTRFNHDLNKTLKQAFFSTEVLETLTLKTAVVAAELILKHALLSECQCEISE